jgi:hypothetical protein
MKFKHKGNWKLFWRSGYLKIPLAKRSPHLTPPDFCLWGILKGQVYMKKTWTTELKENIWQETEVIHDKMFPSVSILSNKPICRWTSGTTTFCTLYNGLQILNDLQLVTIDAQIMVLLLKVWDLSERIIPSLVQFASVSRSTSLVILFKWQPFKKHIELSLQSSKKKKIKVILWKTYNEIITTFLKYIYSLPYILWV